VSVDRSRLASIIESLIFVSDEPLAIRRIRNILEGVPAGEIDEAISFLKNKYSDFNNGIRLEEVAEGYQFRTAPENVEWVKMLVEYRPTRLSKAAMETLAIIAYNQPCTKVDVEAVRGVESSSPVSVLLEKNLINILGRKEAVGRPLIYGTTKEFLETFNLKDLDDLPTLKEISESEVMDTDQFNSELARTMLEQRQSTDDPNQDKGSFQSETLDDPSKLKDQDDDTSN